MCLAFLLRHDESEQCEMLFSSFEIWINILTSFAKPLTGKLTSINGDSTVLCLADHFASLCNKSLDYRFCKFLSSSSSLSRCSFCVYKFFNQTGFSHRHQKTRRLPELCLLRIGRAMSFLSENLWFIRHVFTNSLMKAHRSRISWPINQHWGTFGSYL